MLFIYYFALFWILYGGLQIVRWGISPSWARWTRSRRRDCEDVQVRERERERERERRARKREKKKREEKRARWKEIEKEREGEILTSISRFVAALTLLLEMFGLTILTLLFTPLNCTYYPDRSPTLDINPNITCWQGNMKVRGERK